MTKDAIMTALFAFIAKRPGLDPREYISDWRDTEGRRRYSQESRAITKDRHIAEALLRKVSRTDGISAQDIVEAAKGAFGGRLSINVNDRGEIVLDYCTGQYWPTEYRKAVAATMRLALRRYWDFDTNEKLLAEVKRSFRQRAVVNSFLG